MHEVTAICTTGHLVKATDKNSIDGLYSTTEVTINYTIPIALARKILEETHQWYKVTTQHPRTRTVLTLLNEVTIDFTV